MGRSKIDEADRIKRASPSFTGATITELQDDGDGPEARVTLLIYHRAHVQSVPLAPGATITIGRHAPSNIIVDDKGLSRQHVRIGCEGDTVWVEDLKSTNGTRVNGRRIERTELGPNDEIRIGGLSVFVHRLAQADEGLIAHERFMSLLEHEVARAKIFGRPLAVLLFRRVAVSTDGRAFAARFAARARAIDRAASYTPDMVEVMLPELDRGAALEVARALVRGEGEESPSWVAGAAMFGSHAPSAGVLLENAVAASRNASWRDPVCAAEADPEPRSAGDRAFVFESPRMRELRATLERVAPKAMPILITGETGTGKEVLARLAHEASGARARGPFRAINCGAIPPSLLESALFGHEKGAFTGASARSIGVFEQAAGGTLFLDEIGELSPAAQAAILRALETKQITRIGAKREVSVDVRIVAATHRNLELMAKQGRFRSDLFYRLSGVVIALPALRDRPEDIAALAQLFLAEANAHNRSHVARIGDEALEALRSQRWPGNVRELKNTIERAVALATSDQLELRDFAFSGEQARGRVVEHDEAAATFGERVRAFEERILREALESCGNNRTEVAKLLGIPRRTLTNKLRAYQLHEEYPPPAGVEKVEDDD